MFIVVCSTVGFTGVANPNAALRSKASAVESSGISFIFVIGELALNSHIQPLSSGPTWNCWPIASIGFRPSRLGNDFQNERNVGEKLSKFNKMFIPTH